MIKVSDYVVTFLEEKKIGHIFLICGGGAMFLNDSFGRSKTIKYIPVLHEQAGAIAADAYARYSEKAGAALFTTGPGGTNSVTGVAGSWADSIPVFILSGQVKTENLIGDQGLRTNGYQEAEIVKIVQPITKYAVTVMEPKKIAYHLEKAWHLMTTGRPGPVWLDIPLDIQNAEIDPEKVIHFEPNRSEQDNSRQQELLMEKVLKAQDVLSTAKRPVLLAGNGIRLAHAMPEFYEMLEKLGIPLLLTWGAMDFVGEDQPLYFGKVNIRGASRAANFILQNADVILSVGARLGISVAGYNAKAFARAGKLIVVDVDPKELEKKLIRPYLPIEADAKDFLTVFNQIIPSAFAERELKEWMAYCRRLKAKYPITTPEDRVQQEFVNPHVFIDMLSGELTREAVIIPTSSSTAFSCTNQAFKVKAGQRIFTSRGLSAMGWDIPSAIGACLASGKKQTICITGDGSIQLNIQELQTIVTNQLPIKIFVFVNNGYSMIKNTQDSYFDGRYVGCNPESGLCLPDLGKIARAYGIHTEKINNNAQISETLKKVLAADSPVLCELNIDPNQTILPRLASAKDKDGKMVSKPIEDLFPFLERTEFNENMVIPPFADDMD
jgi:acetolactate synthase-1/2/3 large subunit